MMPASQPATRSPPKRGATATTRPAATSTTPTMCIASAALPGMMLSNSLDRLARPVVGEHLGEFVKAHEDRRDREGLGRGIAAERLALRDRDGSKYSCECGHAPLATRRPAVLPQPQGLAHRSPSRSCARPPSG